MPLEYWFSFHTSWVDLITFVWLFRTNRGTRELTAVTPAPPGPCCAGVGAAQSERTRVLSLFDISPARIETRIRFFKAMFPNLREQHYVFMLVFRILKPQHFQCPGKIIHWRSWMVVRWRGESWGLGQGATTAGGCCAGRRLRVTTISWWQDSRSIQSSPGERRGGPCEQTQ